MNPLIETHPTHIQRHVISEYWYCISASDGWSWSHTKVSVPRGSDLTPHQARPMLQPLIRQKHNRCGSRSSSNQLMSLSGKNESLSPVPTLPCLRSKQQFKCVHEGLFVSSVSWASGHLRECTHTYTVQTACPVRNRNHKVCSRFTEHLHVSHESNRNRLLWNVFLQFW